MGGGSSEVTPHRRRRVDEALAERLPDASISSEVGCRIDRGMPAIDLRLLSGGDAAGRLLRQRRPWRARRWRRRRRIRPGSCGSAPRSRGSPWARARSRLSATFTPDVSGAWQLGLESAGRAVLRLDGAVVVDNTEPVRGSSFYGAGSEPVEVTVDLVAGRSYELTVDIWPRSSLLPHHGGTHRRLAPGHGRRVRARGGRRRRGRRRRGRRRLQRAMGVRGPRPPRPLAARPPA